MKIIFSLLLLLLFSACEKRKTWECTCDYFNPYMGGGKEVSVIENTKQTDAKRKCNAHGSDLSGADGKYSCDIEVKR